MIKTKSKFWYGLVVTKDNRSLPFKYAVGLERVAKLRYGSYSPDKLAIEIKRAMEEVGTGIFTVTFDLATRKFTISTVSTFSILSLTGSTTNNVFELIGLSTLADKTGASSYVSDTQASIVEYIPQFHLQSVVDGKQKMVLIDETVNRATSGVTEVIHFGEEYTLEFEIQYITDIPQETYSIIETNQNAVDDVQKFLNHSCKKRVVCFFPNRDDETIAFDVLLDKTESESNGTGYALQEQYSKGLVGYYNTGKLTWRYI